MASSGAWYRQGTVTVTNGSASITGVNTDWLTALIAVAIGDIFTVDSKTWYEIVSVSTDTGIALDRNFEGATVAGVNYAIIRNTSGTVLTRIAGQVAVQFNQKQLFLDELRTWLNSTNATEMVTDSHGVSTAITTPTQMASEHSARVAQVDTLVNGISAMTKAEFFALAEQRKSQSAGSGFQEWGKHFEANKINEGLYSVASVSNSLFSGRGASPSGLSKTTSPFVNVDGVVISVEQVNTPSSNDRNNFKFPTAPDGTKTYDSSTGTVTQHASAAIAFAAETATNKVITSRQDFVFIEPWHEKISDKGVVYPLGNVQYGGTTYEGAALAVNGIAQGYSAFGEWDATTTGNCAVWANLTDAQKATFIQDHKNNIYSDNGELIQVRYRIRVVEGLGDDWESPRPISLHGYLRAAPDGMPYVKPKGSGTTPVGGAELNVSTGGLFSTTKGSWGDSFASGSNGIWTAVDAYQDTDGITPIAHNGLCFAMSIALVQRRNQGAYHPAYNPGGTACVGNNSYGTDGYQEWWNSSNGGALIPTSTLDCFTTVKSTSALGGGAIGSTRLARSDGKFYDAIYASDVFDLRMSSKKLPLKEIREKYKRMAIAGEVRGFEGVPFTTFNSSLIGSGGHTNAGDNYDLVGFTRPVIYMESIASLGANINQGTRLTVVDTSNGYYMSGIVFATPLNYIYLDNTGFINRGLPGKGTGISTLMLLIEVPSAHKQANPTWTDIIGSPENIAATFPNGVEGQWIPKIPDGGGNITFDLNRKATVGGANPWEYTADNGATWSAAQVAVNSTTNSFDGGTVNTTGNVSLVHYETQAHFTQDDDNSKVLDLGGDVYATCSNFVDYGNILCGSLIGKIPTASVNEYVMRTSKGALSSSNVLDSGLWAGGGVEHFSINKLTDSVAVKTLDYLSQENNVAKLCYVYKEMKFDGLFDTPDEVIQINTSNVDQDPVINSVYSVSNDVSGVMGGGVWRNIGGGSAPFNSVDWRLLADGKIYYKTESYPRYERVSNLGWGDNNQFEIANNKSSLTDDNGNTVLYGTASFDTQYFISEE